jgi:hypothetical protein
LLEHRGPDLEHPVSHETRKNRRLAEKSLATFNLIPRFPDDPGDRAKPEATVGGEARSGLLEKGFGRWLTFKRAGH